MIVGSAGLFLFSFTLMDSYVHYVSRINYCAVLPLGTFLFFMDDNLFASSMREN